LAGDVGPDIRFVLVIGTYHVDRLALHLAAEILHRHLCRDQRARAGRIGIKTVHVGQNADPDHVVRNLCVRAAGSGQNRKHGERGRNECCRPHGCSSDFLF
jgi:hypothetical protein